MKIVTNGTFAISIIPECKATSLTDWAILNNLSVINSWDTDLDYYIPYRSSYERVIRGLGADFHELMINDNVVNLNVSTWDNAKDIAIEYITTWFSSNTLPIKKDNCHSAFYSAYVNAKLDLARAIFFDVSTINNLPNILNTRYNLTLDNTIPDLALDFYEHTVPYWVIDELYNSNRQLAEEINKLCAQDTMLNKQFTIINL